jgi:Mrp family chromosome partitioning ATPase
LNSAGRLHDGASVFVTAAQTSWAKSEVALNLALAEAAAGKRVLLVDADTSNRVLTKHFGADNLAGLTDELSGAEAPWVTDSASGLTFIAAGTRQAPGDSARNAAAVREWLDLNGQGFDLVVIDGPSAASDLTAGNWATPAWATLLVLHESLTRKDLALGTFERLDRAAPRRVTVALATI